MKATDIPPPPTGKSHMDVITEYLSKLREAIYSDLRRSFEMEEVHIQWWFAIPPVWEDIEETPLRGPAFLAGYIRPDHDDRIFFITEPVSYLLHCCKTLVVQPSDTFLVVVAGRATVDLATYEVITGDPLTMKQLTPPSGDTCG
jgi:hypothetical protein